MIFYREKYKALFIAAVCIICLAGNSFCKDKDVSFEQELPTREALIQKAIEGIPSEMILTLEECVEIALKNSKELEISFKKIDLAKLKKDVAMRDLFPSLALSWSNVSGEDAETDNSVERPDYEGSQYGIEAEHEIWPRDFVRYSYLQTGENIKFNEIGYEKTKEDLIYETKKAFYELAKAKKDLEKHLEISAKAEKLYELGEKKQSAGLISQLEYLKVVSRYNEIKSQQKTKKYLLKLSMVKLRNLLKLDKDVLLGIKEGDVYDGDEKKFPPPEINNNEQEVLMDYLNLALSNRLEMDMQDSKIYFYEYGEKAAKGKGKPKFSLIGSFKRVGDAYDPDDVDYESEWFIGTKVSIPWFGNSIEYSIDTGRSVPNRTSTYSTANESDTTQQSIKIGILNNLSYYYDEREAEIAYESAINEKDEEAAKIIMETAQAFYLYKKSLITANAGFEKLRFSIKQEEITDTMRQLGEETISSSLNALVELQQAGVEYNQALMEYYISILDLNKAVGKQVLS